MAYLNETIGSISTPLGEGGISVLRLSGSNAFHIIENIFYKSKDKKKTIKISEIPSHTLHFGYLFDNDLLVDEVIISIFKSPNSFTGEDIVEISTHGGILVTQKALQLILKNGAKHSDPGEFTKRAFLNGRIDLTQAEAIADLIHAKTDEAHISSIKQLEGSLSEYVKRIRDNLISITALVELELDFAEEDLEFAHKSELRNKSKKIIGELKEIVNTYINGKVIRDGVKVVIAGKPNSGKSSLFNNLLKNERAIVSHISGTTRDYIEEELIINGVLFNLTDTAGLRVTDDEIESEGIKRSYDKLNDADLILFLIDSTDSIDNINKSIEYFNISINKNKILVYTKKDVSGVKIPENSISISIFDDSTIKSLKEEMVKNVNLKEGSFSSDKIIITNIRHKICLESTIDSLSKVIDSINDNMSGEFISIDLRNALNHLGEITGSVTNDDILTYVFSRFCIGK